MAQNAKKGASNEDVPGQKKSLKVTFPKEDGAVEIGYFDEEGRFQAVLSVSQDQVRINGNLYATGAILDGRPEPIPSPAAHDAAARLLGNSADIPTLVEAFNQATFKDEFKLAHDILSSTDEIDISSVLPSEVEKLKRVTSAILNKTENEIKVGITAIRKTLFKDKRFEAVLPDDREGLGDVAETILKKTKGSSEVGLEAFKDALIKNQPIFTDLINTLLRDNATATLEIFGKAVVENNKLPEGSISEFVGKIIKKHNGLTETITAILKNPTLDKLRDLTQRTLATDRPGTKNSPPNPVGSTAVCEALRQKYDTLPPPLPPNTERTIRDLAILLKDLEPSWKPWIHNLKAEYDDLKPDKST